MCRQALIGRELADVEAHDVTLFGHAAKEAGQFGPAHPPRFRSAHGRHLGGVEDVQVDADVDAGPQGGDNFRYVICALRRPVEGGNARGDDLLTLFEGQRAHANQRNRTALRDAASPGTVTPSGSLVLFAQVGVSINVEHGEVRIDVEVSEH